MKHAPQCMRTYSLTAVCAGRRRMFQMETTANLMLDVIRGYRVKGNFELYAFVLMPDHLHLLLTPGPDVAVEKVMQLIKGGFSFRLKSKLEVWDRGYFDRRITDEVGFDACRRYIEHNPVRARIVGSADDYPYTSLKFPEMLDLKPEWFSQPDRG